MPSSERKGSMSYLHSTGTIQNILDLSMGMVAFHATLHGCTTGNKMSSHEAIFFF